MDKIKKGLGRGLSSLIGETKIEVQKNQLPVSRLNTKQIPTKKKF
jgi:ParB family chromosome partitioning protein